MHKVAHLLSVVTNGNPFTSMVVVHEHSSLVHLQGEKGLGDPRSPLCQVFRARPFGSRRGYGLSLGSLLPYADYLGATM